MPAGRPTDYDPKYCELIVEMGRKGMTIDEFASEIGVHVSTIYRWEQAHEEFSEAKRLAKQHCANWWLARGRECLILGKDDKFQQRVWDMAMKNIAGWRDRTEVEQTTRGEIDLNMAGLSTDEMRRLGEIIDKAKAK